uniref:Uncharacterized protein n=1 Tax=Rhizophora mucronata TaxID=61149 RepID=A0A2P2MZ60_RHIMU
MRATSCSARKIQGQIRGSQYPVAVASIGKKVLACLWSLVTTRHYSCFGHLYLFKRITMSHYSVLHNISTPCLTALFEAL